MTKRQNVQDMRPKDNVEEVYLLKVITLLESKDGKKYLNIVLSDATGEVEGRVWNTAEEMMKLVDRGDYVKCTGKVNYFQGRRQLNITGLVKVPAGQVNRDDFIFKSKEDPEKMYKQLLGIVETMNDVYLKLLLQNVLGDEEIARRLKTWQAGKSVHHAYQSGLLEHILSSTILGNMLARHYGVNHNYVIAGNILHDICKIYELSDGVNVDYTEEGKLVGHLVKGVELLDRYAYRIKNFPHGMKLHLKHILVSHHGEYEYGSPKLPSTSEAYLVHIIDMMDSKMNAFEMSKRLDNNSGHWTGYIKHLDRVIYKADLPFYDQFVEEEENPVFEAPKKSSNKVVAPGKELKQNLGELLSGLQINTKK